MRGETLRSDGGCYDGKVQKGSGGDEATCWWTALTSEAEEQILKEKDASLLATRNACDDFSQPRSIIRRIVNNFFKHLFLLIFQWILLSLTQRIRRKKCKIALSNFSLCMLANESINSWELKERWCAWLMLEARVNKLPLRIYCTLSMAPVPLDTFIPSYRVSHNTRVRFRLW